MGLRIKRGDTVVVLAGKDRGKKGKVLRVLVDRNRAIVEGVNLVKKSVRRRTEAEPGGIKEVPGSIHLSNLALFCSHCNRGVRFGTKMINNKEKVRVCKRCQQPI